MNVKKLLEGKKIEWIVLTCFTALYIAVTILHEPWFDEAQAWQIAKCASLKEILFDIPHFEGHPALWHLILAIPAKLGVPFEIGLKSVGFIISAIAAYLLIFHSRLPRIIRLVVPFTYFFFYQYGIVVRPYGLMLVFMLLIGMNLNERNGHPWRVTILLALLCLSSAYGILFAGGIALGIVWELIHEKGISRMLRELFRDPRTNSLLALLAVALLLLLQIYPDPNAYGTSIIGKTPLALRIFCAFFTFPTDCFLSTSTWFGIEQVSMQKMQIPTTELLLCAVLGFLLWLLLICASSKNTLKFFVIPYALYILFAAAVYFSTHHMGIVFILTLSWAEFVNRSPDRFEIGKGLINKISQTERDKRLLKRSGIILLSACVIIPLYWSASASMHDVQLEYCYAHSAAAFIKEHHLENLKILCPWNDDGSLKKGSGGNKNYINTDVVSTAVPLVAYFDHNIILNLNNGGEDAYVHHRTISYDESRINVGLWREAGIPDIIINRPNLELVYGDSISYKDYSVVWENRSGFIWKNAVRSEITVMYVRNDLLDEYGLEPVENAWYDYWINGAPITEEMRERYRNGEPIEDIIDPILDQMFGPETKR